MPSLLLNQPGLYELHAGAIAVGNSAHLVLGAGRVGKSTLILEAWLAGQTVLGDDRLVIDATGGGVLAVPKPVKIRLGGRALPSRLGPRLLGEAYTFGHLAGEARLMLHRSLPGMAPVGRAYEIGGVHILRRAGGRRSSKRPATRYEAITALLEQSFAGSYSNLGVLRPFAAALREQRIDILEVGDNDLARALALSLS